VRWTDVPLPNQLIEVRCIKPDDEGLILDRAAVDLEVVAHLGVDLRQPVTHRGFGDDEPAGELPIGGSIAVGDDFADEALDELPFAAVELVFQELTAALLLAFAELAALLGDGGHGIAGG